MTSNVIEPDISFNARTYWFIMAGALLVAVISLPWYQHKVEDQTRKVAFKALNKAVILQAVYFQKNGRYTDQVAELGLPASGGASSFMVSNWQYRIELAVSSETNQPYYVLTTVPYGAGAEQKTIYRIDSEQHMSHKIPGQTFMPGWAN